MARCSYCGRETELYEGGTPTCIRCADRFTPPEQSIHLRLVGELADATAKHLEAKAAYKASHAGYPEWHTPSRWGAEHPFDLT